MPLQRRAKADITNRRSAPGRKKTARILKIRAARSFDECVDSDAACWKGALACRAPSFLLSGGLGATLSRQREARNRLAQHAHLVLQRMRGCRSLLDEGGILLRDLIHLA